MKTLKIVFATDDGNSFMDRHFGDAKYFDLHEIGSDHAQFIRRIENSVSKKDESHADGQKAFGIAGLFKADGIQVLVSKKFGANINKMKTQFVCVLMNDGQISKSVKTIQREYERIVTEWNRGKTRHFINLKQ
jgi:predicted Fe-Mo cluster-binding NifX family protein